MTWAEMVGGGMMVLLVGMTAWVIKLLGNHVMHRLGSVEERLDAVLEKILSIEKRL